MLNVSWFSRLGRPFLSRHSATDLAQPAAPDLLAEFPQYFALRSIEHRLARELIETLPGAAFDESSRILGLQIDDTERTNFNTESMTVEHALFHYRWDGLNAVELRARDNPPPQESLEAKWLCGLLASYYTIGIVRRRLPGFGAELVDVFSEEERLVGDLTFGRTASIGSVVAARLIPVDELWMISASSLAIIDEPRVLHQMREYCNRRFPNLRDVRELDAAEAFEFQTQLIRLVASYGSNTILFSMGDEAQKLLRTALPEPRQAETRRRRKIGRNEPCPCGSGAKYKRCCGRGIR